MVYNHWYAVQPYNTRQNNHNNSTGATGQIPELSAILASLTILVTFIFSSSRRSRQRVRTDVTTWPKQRRARIKTRSKTSVHTWIAFDCGVKKVILCYFRVGIYCFYICVVNRARVHPVSLMTVPEYYRSVNIPRL